jgi:glycosyltransferase GT-like protein
MEIISHQEKGVYLRFGDGDVLLADGQDDSLQKNNPHLQREMREALALNGPHILKCLPLGCKELGGYEEGMFEGNHGQSFEWCVQMLSLAAPLWNGKMDDVYSMTALAYCSTHNVEMCLKFLKFLKQSNVCLLVGNCNIPASVREMLFGSQCQFIPTPSQNSYDEIDRIEKECLEKIQNRNGYKIIVTSMGCSGRALQKRLWNKLDNVFLFDFGSLMDAICGWPTRQWIDLTHFDTGRFLHMLEKELVNSQIRVVCAAALIEYSYKLRKEEYITSLKIIKDFGYHPYVIEACQPSPPTFFEDYTPYVFYSNVNNPKLINKGVNEAKSLMEGFKHYNFFENDMIIKLTGRYRFNSRAFLQLVENHPEVDAFVKIDPSVVPYGKAFAGCFALRHHLFQDLLRNLDLVKMEEQLIDLEVEIAKFIQKISEQGASIMYIDNLDVTANIGSPSPPVLTQW